LEDLNWGYVQLAIVTIIFSGLQIWWISKVFKNQRTPRSMDNREFRRKTNKILQNQLSPLQSMQPYQDRDRQIVRILSIKPIGDHWHNLITNVY
jgi:hypothetical protein